MRSIDSPNSQFELQENWQRIEFTGLEHESVDRKRLAYFLHTAQGNWDDFVHEEDKITINTSPANQNCDYLVTVINVMLKGMPGLQVTVY